MREVMKQIEIKVIVPGYIYRLFSAPAIAESVDKFRTEITDPSGDLIFEWERNVPIAEATYYVAGYDKAWARHAGEPPVITIDDLGDLPKDLRDEFALAVLSDVYKTVDELGKGGFVLDQPFESVVSKMAWKIADAMMSGRRGKP